MKKILAIALTALSINAFAQIPTTGLVGYYQLNGSASDGSGNSNDGTMTNGATFTTDRFGNANSAALLDGTNDYIALPSGSSTSLNITGDFTVSYWIKTTDLAAIITTLGNSVYANSGGYLTGLGLGNVGSGKVTAATQGINWTGSNSNAIPDNTWHHVTVLLKSDTLKYYIDDVLDNQVTGILSPLSWNGNRVLGCRDDLYMTAGANYAGALDDLRIYNVALTSTEVSSLFTEGMCYQTTYDTVTVAIYDTNYVTLTDTNYVTITDTNYVTDTSYVTITDTNYISVSDTLVINVVLSGINNTNNTNIIKIYPNPAATHIYIDNGDYSTMNGYTLRIDNSLNQTVFTSPINQQQFYVDLSTWSGKGIYFVYVIDNLSNTLDVRKIILQ